MWLFFLVIVLLFLVIFYRFQIHLGLLALVRECYYYFIFHAYRYKLLRTMNSAGRRSDVRVARAYRTLVF